jgi:hypothetical protein
MRARGAVLGFVAVLCACFAARAQGGETILTNADVVAMVKAGLGPVVVKAKISASPCRFDASVSALTALKAAQVPDDIVAAVIVARCAPEPLTTRSIEFRWGAYVAKMLAANSEYGVLTEDPVQLALLAAEAQKDWEDEIVAIQIRTRDGKVLAKSGVEIRNLPAQPASANEHLETETTTGMPVILFRAPVGTCCPGNKRTDPIGGVDVAIVRKR